MRKAADKYPAKEGVRFYHKDNLLYRKWIPPNRGEDMLVEQLALALQCRKTVLQLAHVASLARHLGSEKTARRVLQIFYWPTLYRDVGEFCKSCGTCQKTSKFV